jgi:hypothetical protein
MSVMSRTPSYQLLLIADRIGTNMNLRRRVCVLGVAAAAGLVSGCGSANPTSVRTSIVEADRLFEPTDEAATLRFADDIMVARVGEGRSFQTDERVPYTEYPATVIRTRVGSAANGQVVRVRQQGGQIGNELFLIEGEPLLTPNRVYVLAVVQAPDGAFVTQPGVGSRDVGDDGTGPQANAAFDRWTRLGQPGKGIGTVSGTSAHDHLKDRVPRFADLSDDPMRRCSHDTCSSGWITPRWSAYFERETVPTAKGGPPASRSSRERRRRDRAD